MLDYVRIALYTLLVIMGFFLYQAWIKDHPVQPALITQGDMRPTDRFVPQAAQTKLPNQTAAPISTLQTVKPVDVRGEVITVTTDLLETQIDTRGGDIIAVKLLNYP